MQDTPLQYCVRATNPGCTISRLFFARYGILLTQFCSCWVPTRVMESKIEVCGIPPLAKNEQDMGHPGFLRKAGFDS